MHVADTARAPLKGGTHGRRGMDAVSVLTLYLVLLLAVPAPLVFAPLGGAGSPSAMLAVVCLLWWCVDRLQRPRALTGFAPVRVAGIGFLVAVLLAYAHAMGTVIPFLEVSPADSALLRALGLVGILLLAHDGVTSRARLETMVSRIVVAGGLVALLGVIQFVTKKPWVDQISIPGLTQDTEIWGVVSRSGLARPSATATSPIEFGVVLTTTLPLAVTFALYAKTRRWVYWGATFAIALAVLLALSRTALIGAVVGLVVVGTGWSNRVRVRALAVAAALLVGVYVMIPGLLGTLTSLFTGFSGDPSIRSRTGSYDVAFAFVGRSPWLGRGFGTFLPTYWILDNQYLLLLVECGVVGLLALLLLVATSTAVSWSSIPAGRRGMPRELPRALAASVLAGALSFMFFDAFSFPQSAGLFFLVMGLCGAQWRLARRDRAPSATTRAV